MKKQSLVLVKRVEPKIIFLRGDKLILDSDLAELYGVGVKRLNQQVKRNAQRFPPDFLIRLTEKEYKVLRLQNATSNNGRGGRRYLPFAFTEHGAIMAATVLNSKRAIEVSIFVVRAFSRMRRTLFANHEIVRKLANLENRLDDHDVDIQELVSIIRELTAPLAKRRRKIGFQLPSGEARARLKAV